jgi:hypothetical protein
VIESVVSIRASHRFHHRVRTGRIKDQGRDGPLSEPYREQRREIVDWCKEYLPCPNKTRWYLADELSHRKGHRYRVDVEMVCYFITLEDAFQFALMWYGLPDYSLDG